MPGFSIVQGIQQKAGSLHSDQDKPGHERAYIRHIQKTQEELEDQAEYDLDSDDEDWLQNRNNKVLHPESLTKPRLSVPKRLGCCIRHSISSMRS